MGNSSEAVQFFETTHRYFLRKTGQELLAVSTILEKTGAVSFKMVRFEVRERAAIMGDLVHDVARLFGLNKLYVESLDPLLVGYLESIKRYYKARVKKILFIEKIVYDAKIGYAGTVDIVYQDEKNRVCLDDFKTGEILPGAKLQTALYKHAFEKNYGITIDERATVRLNADGTWNEKEDRQVYRDRQDFHDAMFAVGLAYWKIKNNVKT